MDPAGILNKYGPQQVFDALQKEQYKRHFPKFAEEILKIAPKGVADSGLVPFKLNRAQRLMDRVVERQIKDEGWVRLCLLKHRQPGGSTWSAGRAYQLIALTPHTHAMVFAHDDPTSGHILNIVRRFYDNTPPKYKPRLYQRPPGGLVFVDPSSPVDQPRERKLGSSIYCQTAKTALSGTGHTLQFVQLSECAKYPYPGTLWSSLTPAIPDVPGTSVILESTAYHAGDWFRQRYERARDDADWQYQALFTPWFLSEEYAIALRKGEKLNFTLDEKQRIQKYNLTPEQIKWYRSKLKDFGDDDVAAEMMKQEYPENDEEAWIDLSAGVFDSRKLFGYLRACVRPPVRRCDLLDGPRLLDNPQGTLSIWAMPDPKEQYDIGADVATGQEGDEFDWSVASVVNRRTRVQVAEWRGKIDPIDYGNLLNNLGRLYSWAQIAIETSGIGFSTNTQLHSLNYPNIYVWRTRGEAVPRFTRFSGWRTSNESKNYLVSITRHHVVNEKLEIRSEILWNEMKTFSTHITDSGAIGYSAQSGCNDDTLMAFMIAIVIGDDERMSFEDEGKEEVKLEFVDPAFVDNFRIGASAQPRDALMDIAEALGRRQT